MLASLPKGTKPKERDKRTVTGGNPKSGASQPRGGKKKRRTKATSAFDLKTLNPPFDSRMRRIGSPLNLTSKIKRGWIQSATSDRTKVAFLYNPSQLDLSHSVTGTVPTEGQKSQQASAQADVMDNVLPTTGSTLSVKLLYDRTYELFSAPRDGDAGFANNYGVWADVAAWYTFLGMFDEMPSTWEDSMIKNPAVYKESYLFIGPRMAFYGYVDGLSVTYSHWTQNMVPARCAISINFQVLPDPGNKVFRGAAPIDVNLGWAGSWTFSPNGEVSGSGLDDVGDRVINTLNPFTGSSGGDSRFDYDDIPGSNILGGG